MGNVTYSRDRGRSRDRSRRMADYHRRHGRGSHSWASEFTFSYRRGGTCMSIHARRDAPYWHNGGWHPCSRGRFHGPGCGRVLYYGYWIDTRDVYYVERREPPWVTVEFWDVDADDWDDAPLDDDRPYEYDVVDEYDGDFIQKSQVRDIVRSKTFVLSTAERRRVDILIAGGIMQQILNDEDGRVQYDFDFDERASRLTLTAPTERIAMIETIVGDRRTFEAVTEPDRYGNTAAVVPLVSPIYLDEDKSGAGRVALDNFYALRRMLEDRDRRYMQNGKGCWYNSEYGTATVVDEEDSLEQAFGFMEMRPFVPRDLVRR